MSLTVPQVADAGTVQCDECEQIHPATYSHGGRFGEGPIYAVVCTADGLTDYYTAARLLPDPAAATVLDLSRKS